MLKISFKGWKWKMSNKKKFKGKKVLNLIAGNAENIMKVPLNTENCSLVDRN